MVPAEPSELIGKMVRDEWGRQVGMVVSVLMDDRGEASWLLVRMGDGEFRRYKLSSISVSGSDVVLLSGIKRRVDALCRREALLKCEKLLLSDLKDGNLSSDMLNEIGREVRRALGFVEGEAKYLLRKVEHLIRKCTDQIRDINRGIACLRVERDLGKVPDEVFSVSMSMLLSGLKSLVSERDDLIEARRKLLELLELLGERPSGELRAEVETGEEAPVKEAEDSPIDVEVEEGSEVALQA